MKLHSTNSFLHLASFAQGHTFEIDARCRVDQYQSILFIAENNPSVRLCPQLSVHSNVKGRPCCFQLEAVMNKRLLTFTDESLCGRTFSFRFGENLGMRLLAHVVRV